MDINQINKYIYMCTVHTSQSSMSTSHRVPVRPTGHTHLKAAIASMHVAPFWHGTEAHSLISVLQSFPRVKHCISTIGGGSAKHILFQGILIQMVAAN